MARRFALVLLGTTGVSLLVRAVVHQLNPVDAMPGICLAAIGFGLIGLVVGRIAEQVVVESVNGLAESRIRELNVFSESLHETRS